VEDEYKREVSRDKNSKRKRIMDTIIAYMVLEKNIKNTSSRNGNKNYQNVNKTISYINISRPDNNRNKGRVSKTILKD